MGEIQRQGEANAHVFLVVDLQMCSLKRKKHISTRRVCRRPRNFMAFNSVIGDVFGWLRVFL